MRVRRYFLILIIAVLCCLADVTVTAANNGAPFYAEVTVSGVGEVRIPLQHLENGDYLFLPSCAKLDSLVLRFSPKEAVIIGNNSSLQIESGVPFSILPVLNRDKESGDLIFQCAGKKVAFTLMHSSTLRTAFLTSGNESQNREYVEADKERKVKGVSFALLRPDGSLIWSGSLKSIKGRGNSTWNYPKKPYQIKLAEKVDLLETGEKAEKENTWILLANYIDESLLRNQISFDLAAEFKLPYSPHGASVDLYYDGEYRGVYLLCEKTEISEGRISIYDLEKTIENTNPDIDDFSVLQWAEGKMESGLVYRFYPDIQAPEDLRGGYLLELDYSQRAMEEPSWFRTINGQYVTVKSPEYLPEAGMQYIASLYQRFERAVLAGGIDPVTGEDYRELCDLDSLARCFLIMELAKDNDAFLSSTYFYKSERKDLLFSGPVWDFDTGYGVADLPEDISVTSRTVLGNRLLQIPSFRETLVNCWKELKPLVHDILLSTDKRSEGRRLRNIDSYNTESAVSRRMDRVLWGRKGQDLSIDSLRDFLVHRTAWLDKQVAMWTAGEIPDLYFQDIKDNDWFYESVEYAVEHGLFTGSSVTQFEPYSPINRSMAVAVLYRMAGSPETNHRSDYKDIDHNAWYKAAVDWATENQIADGIGKSLFAPNRLVSREQLITLLYRLVLNMGMQVENKHALSAFSDSEEISPWAFEAMAWAVDSGIIKGANGRLNPQGDTTRAQAAAIVSRVYQLYFDMGERN